MVTEDEPLGIFYPDRAEEVVRYADYKVFVDFWSPLTDHLSEQFRRLYLRRQPRILGIYGEQGSGKTLFATQLLDDYRLTKSQSPSFISTENVWHRVAQGAGATINALREATRDCICQPVPDAIDWPEQVKRWRGSTYSPLVAIADNTETDYFLRGLSKGRYPDANRTNETYLEVAAENLVKEMRNPLFEESLSGTLLILLSNDRNFLDTFKGKVDDQHRGLMEVIDLPLPTAAEKERAVRVNVNRLNSVSYWYCLDKGGDKHKKAVRGRLLDATTFPDAFDAVDQALGASTVRPGRPGKKNLLTVINLVQAESVGVDLVSLAPQPKIEAHHKWLISALSEPGWGVACGLDARRAGLLESEWQLRVVALGEPFVAALLAAEAMDGLSNSWSAGSAELTSDLFRLLQQPLGPTSTTVARKKYEADLVKRVDSWLADVSPARAELDLFWKAGQGRSAAYEAKLALVLGVYNRTTSGFLAARPDYVAEDFNPASLTSATQNTTASINLAIQRNAHAIEFTSQASPSAAALGQYLAQKLPNYVLATQEQ